MFNFVTKIGKVIREFISERRARKIFRLAVKPKMCLQKF